MTYSAEKVLATEYMFIRQIAAYSTHVYFATPPFTELMGSLMQRHTRASPI